MPILIASERRIAAAVMSWFVFFMSVEEVNDLIQVCTYSGAKLRSPHRV